MVLNLDLRLLECVLHDVTDLPRAVLRELRIDLCVVPIGVDVSLYNIAVHLVVAIIMISADAHLAPQADQFTSKIQWHIIDQAHLMLLQGLERSKILQFCPQMQESTVDRFLNGTFVLNLLKFGQDLRITLILHERLNDRQPQLVLLIGQSLSLDEVILHLGLKAHDSPDLMLTLLVLRRLLDGRGLPDTHDDLLGLFSTHLDAQDVQLIIRIERSLQIRHEAFGERSDDLVEEADTIIIISVALAHDFFDLLMGAAAFQDELKDLRQFISSDIELLKDVRLTLPAILVPFLHIKEELEVLQIDTDATDVDGAALGQFHEQVDLLQHEKLEAIQEFGDPDEFTLSDLLSDGFRADSPQIQLDDFVLLRLRQVVLVNRLIIVGAVLFVILRHVTVVLERLIGSLGSTQFKDLHSPLGREFEPMYLDEFFAIELIIRQEFD